MKRYVDSDYWLYCSVFYLLNVTKDLRVFSAF